MKNLIIWLNEGKYLFIFLILLTFVLGLDKINIGLSTEGNIKVYGLILQIIGSMTLIYSLRGKLVLFKGWKLADFFKDYFKRCPVFIKKTVINLGPINFEESETMTAELRSVLRPQEDFKDIIRYFDEEIDYLHQRVARTKMELKSDIHKVADDFNDYKVKNSLVIQETKNLISDSSVSNIWQDLFGIFSILLGLVCATIPELIEKLFF